MEQVVVVVIVGADILMHGMLFATATLAMMSSFLSCICYVGLNCRHKVAVVLAWS